MTTQEFKEKYPDVDFTHFPGDGESRCKAIAPLFEELPDKKMIYHEHAVGWLIQLENLEITSDGFKAVANPLCIIYDNFRGGGEYRKLKQWEFASSWDWMMLGEGLSFHTPYAGFTIWLEAERIKQVIDLAEQNRFDETYDAVWKEETKRRKNQQTYEIQRVVGDIEILQRLAQCWKNYNPYHIKDFLHEDLLYHSEFSENDIVGKDAFFKYFIDKLNEYKAKTKAGTVTAKIGYLKNEKFIGDYVFGNSQPCVAVRQQGEIKDTVSIIKIESKDGKIVKITVSNKPEEDGWNGLIENPFHI